MEINTELITKGLDAVANLSKTAANVTNPEKKQKTDRRKYKEGDTNNQQHQQTVEVHVGEAEKAPQPVVIREKPETHIHKRFPDNRALTKEECALEEVRVKLEFEESERERNFQREMDEKNRKERKEREEYERAERIRKEAERKRQRKIHSAIAGGIGLGLVGFALYSWARDERSRRFSQSPALPAASEVKVEGTVE